SPTPNRNRSRRPRRAGAGTLPASIGHPRADPGAESDPKNSAQMDSPVVSFQVDGVHRFGPVQRDHGYIMEQGRIVLEGPTQDLKENPDVKEFYLGLGDEGTRKSYRDVKHYKRRKRWL
ncbi:MAG TPA: hypothetical protein VFC57_01220, partial [Aeromicrobium sp.]|nr:hypothetical protein [Aeromicrobium sp.]